MVNNRARRQAPVLGAGLVGAGAWCLWSLAVQRQRTSAFLSARPAGVRVAGRTAVRGFREEFDAWRASLTPEEQTMIQTQAEKEFNKKFRKSDEFQKNLPEEKQAEFAKILKKFMDNEAKDYKKDDDGKTPDYDGLLKKTSQKTMDFSLKNKVIKIDRDADRRYAFATRKERLAKAKGERFPQSSPLIQFIDIKNDDEQSHNLNQGIIDFLKKASEDSSIDDKWKADLKKTAERGVPKMGEQFKIAIPQVLMNQVEYLTGFLKAAVDKEKDSGKSEEELENLAREIGGKTLAHLAQKYTEAHNEVEKEVETMKAFYRSQKDMPGKTKADVLKEIWEELPKHTDKPVPPLDEEMLAELAEEPAIIEGEFRHNWGTADVLYKSEAIDAFGAKYLLGVFETKDEAQKAFDAWNAEYEQARVEMKAELEQWGKQEQARLDKDSTGRDRIKEVLEEARR